MDDNSLADGHADHAANDHLLLQVIDFLREYHQLTRPPVRDIGRFGEFLQRQEGLPDPPAVAIQPAPDVWLHSVLLDSIEPPPVPAALAEWVTKVSATEAPAIPLGDDASDAALEAAVLLDDWVTTVWEPWATQWRENEAGRSFYKALFALRTMLERENDNFELAWGFGRLRWQTDQGLIDHPLLVAPVEITFDSTDPRGALNVSPTGPIDLELSCLTEVDLSNRPAYLALRDNQAADELPVWDEALRTEFLARVQRLLDHDGSCGPVANPTDRARISDEWALFVRRRSADYVGFLDAQHQLLRDGAAPSGPLRSLVSKNPSTLGGGTDASAGDPSTATGPDVLFLPKPANEEQHRVLRLAQNRIGVTTQGPPGTGKSHTIANLVCHYVALGQRVLVTAEKEAALRVLADKLPSRVRELTVSVLGGDHESRTRLETAIKNISGRVGEYDARFVDGQIDEYTNALDDTDRAIARTGNAFRDACAFEARPLTGTFAPGVDPTPGAIADWLARNADALGGIPDALPLHTPVPLTQEEWQELVRLGTRVDPQDVLECARPRPEARLLPRGATLDEAACELDHLRTALADVDQLVMDWDPIDAVSPQRLADIRETVTTAADWRIKTAGTWIDRVRVESADSAIRSGWDAFAADVRATREGALVSRQAIAAYQVNVPAVVDPAVEAGLKEARDRFEAGKGVSKLLQRSAAQALQSCSVDGREPCTASEVDLCLAALRLQAHRQRLANLWRNSIPRVKGPTLEEERPTEDGVAEHLEALDAALAWSTSTWPRALEALAELGITAAPDPDPDALATIVTGLEVIGNRVQERRIAREFAKLERYLASGAQDGASMQWGSLSAALEARQWMTWDSLVDELVRLEALAADAGRLTELEQRLADVVPECQRALAASRYEVAPTWETFGLSWQWRQLDGWLQEATAGPSAGELQREIDQLTARRLRIMEDLVAARAWRGLVDHFNDEHRAALGKYLAATKRFGRTGGRYKNRWLREIREALDESKEAVPVWIMPVSKALTSFRPAANPPFDVIIIDEASQIDLKGLPVLSLAKRAIVVGDDQQTSPENVGLHQQAVFDLIDSYLSSVPDARTVFDPGQSLYDVAQVKFPEVVTLREHFRCLPDIIAFSNSHFYDNAMIPLRDRPPNLGWQQVGTIFVSDGYRNARGVNEPEANAVVDLICRLCADPEYADMTFGVIALLGQAQAQRIEELLIDRLGPAEMERRKIRCGDAPTFQGDERDVMILSLVVDKPEGTRLGAMTRLADLRRINVAASRAADQMWIVHSIPPEDFPNGDPRAELIRHCRDPREADTLVGTLEERCESEFERDVLRRIVDRGYRRVHTQYEVGRKRIDIVVEGPESRLAVEVDGEAWHGPDRWEEDRVRQQTLERAGWRFERIRGSAFYRDPARALEPLWQRLDELGIPTGEWWNVPRPRPAQTIAPARRAPEQLEVDDESTEQPAADQPTSDQPAAPVDRSGPTEPTSRRRRAAPVPRDPAATTAARPERRTGHVDPPPATVQKLEPYQDWVGGGATPVDTTPPAELVQQLLTITAVEGPLHAARLFRLHAVAAGAQRVGRQMKQQYNRALSQATRKGQVLQVADGLSGIAEKTIYMPDTRPVRIRTLGSRELFEVPRSEVQALLVQLGLGDAAPEEQKRAVLAAYGLRRLTQRASEYLDSCIAYRWDGQP